jgi:predicted kinase
MMRQPTLFLTVGLPCTGKTTAARRIEIEQKALRLTKDEWVKALYGHENPPSAQGVIEGRLIQIGLRALELGNNIVIDYGLWGRDERSALRQAAADLGAMVEMRYFELASAEQRSDLISAKPKRHTRLGPCPTRNSPSGLPTSTSQPPANSTAVNPLMTHRLDTRHGTSGADTAGRCRSPDACSSQRCHDRSSACMTVKPDDPVTRRSMRRSTCSARGRQRLGRQRLAGESAGGISPPAALRTGRDSLPSSGPRSPAFR